MHHWLISNKWYPILDQDPLMSIPYPRVDCCKTISFKVAHTHIDHINHPPPPTLLYFITRIATLVEKEILFFD